MKKACHRHHTSLQCRLTAVRGKIRRVKSAVPCIRIKSVDLQGFFSAPASSLVRYFGLFCLFLAASCLLISCGKKGDPTLKSYEKPPPPELRAVHRQSGIILSWNFPKAGEQSLKGFHLLKSAGGDFKKVAFIEKTDRSFTDKDFQTGHKYKYKIISESLKGVLSIDSNVLDIKPKIPPSPPTDISFLIEHDFLTIKWNASGEADFYNVYKSDKQGDYALSPVNKEPLKETYFKDAFSVKKPVYYTIRSLLGGDIRDEGEASREIVIDPSEFVPHAPEGLQAVIVNETVYLIWKEPADTWIYGYKIYREIEKGEGYLLIGESQTPSFLDKDKPLTKRNYRVTAMGPVKEGPPIEIRGVFYGKKK